jgi:hypothetical protein
LIERVTPFVDADATPLAGVTRLVLLATPPSPAPSPGSAPLPKDPFAGDPTEPRGWLKPPEGVAELIPAGVVAGVSAP